MKHTFYKIKEKKIKYRTDDFNLGGRKVTQTHFLTHSCSACFISCICLCFEPMLDLHNCKAAQQLHAI